MVAIIACILEPAPVVGLGAVVGALVGLGAVVGAVVGLGAVVPVEGKM